MLTLFPTKNKLLKNFAICANWEEKYLYILNLGKLLPVYPSKLKTSNYLISGCQNKTWIAVVYYRSNISNYKENKTIEFHGYSDSAIIKGIITIIFSLYSHSNNIQKINNIEIKSFFKDIQLEQNLTPSRSQGIHSILESIHKQTQFIKE